jgi:hypothetical protein
MQGGGWLAGGTRGLAGWQVGGRALGARPAAPSPRPLLLTLCCLTACPRCCLTACAGPILGHVLAHPAPQGRALDHSVLEVHAAVHAGPVPISHSLQAQMIHTQGSTGGGGSALPVVAAAGGGQGACMRAQRAAAGICPLRCHSCSNTAGSQVSAASLAPRGGASPRRGRCRCGGPGQSTQCWQCQW